MTVLTTQEGDVLDQLMFAQDGTLSRLEAVLELNPHLAQLGPVLPAGISITLPQDAVTEQAHTVRLWGAE